MEVDVERVDFIALLELTVVRDGWQYLVLDLICGQDANHAVLMNTAVAHKYAGKNTALALSFITVFDKLEFQGQFWNLWLLKLIMLCMFWNPETKKIPKMFFEIQLNPRFQGEKIIFILVV